MSLSQLVSEPTLFLFRSDSVEQIKPKTRILPSASKLTQTDNGEMSLLKFGLISNRRLWFRIQIFPVPRRGNGSQIILKTGKKTPHCPSPNSWQPFRVKLSSTLVMKCVDTKRGKLQSQVRANRPKGDCMVRRKAEPIKITLDVWWEKRLNFTAPSPGTSPIEICQSVRPGHRLKNKFRDLTASVIKT